MGEVYTIISYKDAHGKIRCITGNPCCLRREEMTRIANEREEHRLMLKAFADKGRDPEGQG